MAKELQVLLHAGAFFLVGRSRFLAVLARETRIQVLDLGIPSQQFEARFQHMDTIVNRFQLGRLVHDVLGRGHLAAVVQPGRGFEFVAILVGNPEIFQRSFPGRMRGLGQHHRQHRDAATMPSGVG